MNRDKTEAVEKLRWLADAWEVREPSLKFDEDTCRWLIQELKSELKLLEEMRDYDS